MLGTTIAGLLARKLRVFTTSIAVLLGVSFMAGSLVLTDTLGKTFDDLFADVNAGTDAYVRGQRTVENDFGDDSRTRLDAAVLETVRGVEGVAAAEPSIQGYAQIVGADGDAVGNPGQGPPTLGTNWTRTDALNSLELAAGRAPVADDEVVIDKQSAETGDLDVGDPVTILVKTGAERFKIVGLVTFGDFDSPGGATFVAFTQATAERVITEPGTFNGVSVVADDGISQEEATRRVASVLPDSAEVITGDQLTEETQSDVRAGLSFFNTFLVVFAAVALFVGSFIIYNTFSIIVAQRSRETALLRAIGASRRQVLGSILLEALVVGVVASVLGIVAGLGMAMLLRALLSGFGIDLPAGDMVLSLNTVATCLIIGIGVSVVSAVFPARRAAKVPPVEAMRAVAIEPSKSSLGRAIAGCGLTVAGGTMIAAALFASGGVSMVGLGVPVTFVGLAVLGPILAKPATRFLGAPLPAVKGMPGTLARNNAIRNPKRTSATADALMIGVGLVAFITVFSASAKASIDEVIDDSFGADLILDSGSFGFGGLPPELRDELAQLPEVGTAAAVRRGSAEVDGTPGSLSALDPGIGEIFDLDFSAGALETLGPDELAVSADRAEDKGWVVGDPVTVGFAGSGEQSFTVGAIFENRQLGGDAVVTLEAWEANVDDQFDATVFVLAADGVSAAEVKAAVEAVADAYPTADVQNVAEFKQTQAAQINQLLGLIYALLGLAILIAVLGIANTLALSIFERTRELGLLRAVGMTRSQLRTTVRWESVLIALFGTGLGLVVGIVFGTSVVVSLADEGLGSIVVPLDQLAVIAGLAALCGVLAAVLPARRAARLDVLAAIATV